MKRFPTRLAVAAALFAAFLVGDSFAVKSKVHVWFRLLVGVAGLAWMAYSHYNREILQWAQQFSGKWFSFRRSKVVDVEMLVRGLALYDDDVYRLAQERDLLSSHVLPTLRTEMMSGRKPPYDFSCTVVRTGINNFPKIYSDFPVYEFIGTINEFFTEVTQVVSRYNGLIYEFVGDEVIYYFKDEDVGNSAAIAVSAIRDIHAIAERYDESTHKNRGYNFTVRSSLAHGSMHFQRLVNGFGLAGSILCETGRILSHIDDKHGNALMFDDRHNGLVDRVCNVGKSVSVHSKGFDEKRSLMIYEDHKPLEDILASGDIKHLDDLRFFRSNKDLLAQFAWAREQTTAGNYEAVMTVVSLFKQIPPTRVSVDVQEEFVHWLEEMFGVILNAPKASAQSEPIKETKKILGASLRLAERFVTESDFEERFEPVFREAMKVKDRRVIANALDVLRYFKSTDDLSFSKHLIRHEDNRVAGNALVHVGSKELSSVVVRSLQRMLESRRATHIASALYAIGELAVFHRSRDQRYYTTQISFLRLVQSIPTYVTHKDVMVRRQALLAAKKSEDEKVLHAIREIIVREPRGDLAREADEHLGPALAQAPVKINKAA